MDQENNLSTVLVEFDSIKGPIIRKKVPQNFEFPNNGDLNNILMWVLRAAEFSVRKIESYTAYAKTIALKDPNFSRKKRQFGIAFITDQTYELGKMEEFLNKIISRCQSEGENKPYFRMLYNLLQIIDNITDDNKNLLPIKNEAINSIAKSTTIAHETDEIKQFLLMSNRLNMFNKVSLYDKRTNRKTIVCAADKFSQMQNKIGQIYEVHSEKFQMEADLRYEIPDCLTDGMEILLRIFEVLSTSTDNNNRILVAIEYLDRLLYERVDLEYFLPYLQYFISMENFGITEFKSEEFEEQLPNLMETHGEWINCLLQKNLDGKPLTDFFKLTGIRREGLELLIDLLFVKIIAIF